MALNRVREKYPEFANMPDQELAESLYNSHYSKKMTKEQYYNKLGMAAPEKAPAEKGWSGIASDVQSSLQSAPDALVDMVSSIPGGLKKAARYATSNNPVETLGNIGAGGVESAAGLLSSPQVLMRYLAEKFPEFGKRMEQSTAGGGSFKDPTLYEGLMKFEKEHGMAPQSGDEASVRNAGGLLFGGKALTKLGNALTRTATISAEQGGRGGDPVHAAILGLLGDKLAKTTAKGINKAAEMNNPPAATPPPGSPSLTANIGSMPSGSAGYVGSTISNIPKAAFNIAKAIPEKAVNTVKAIPEVAGQAAATGLETMADLGTKAHIPGVQPTLGALGSYLKYVSVKPEKLAQRKLFEDIDPQDLPKISERMDAAKRLGLGYLTPAEATLSPFEAAKQGTIGRTSSGSKLLFEKGKERTGSEGTAINNLLDTIYDQKTLDPQKAAAYEETMTASVPDDFIVRQMKRPVIEKAIKTLEGNAAYRQRIQEELGVTLGDVKPNSFMYWDMVKRVLGDMGEKAKEQGRATTESDILSDTRRSMVNEMDKIKPEYEVARGIAERKFTRRKLEDVFDKKTMTGNNFYKFLQSKKNFNEVMNKLKAFPDAQQKLKDMHLLFGDLIPNDMSIRSAAALKRTSMSSPRNKLDALKQELDEKYGKEHDVATIKLMTDPDWLNMLAEYIKNHKGSK